MIRLTFRNTHRNPSHIKLQVFDAAQPRGCSVEPYPTRAIGTIESRRGHEIDTLMRLKYHGVKTAPPRNIVSLPTTEWYNIPEEWVELECRRATKHHSIVTELLTTEMKLVAMGVDVGRVNRMVQCEMYYDMNRFLQVPRGEVNDRVLRCLIDRVWL
jgi:hypothetical protein